MREKFYICRHCGNLIGLVHDAGVPMMCCGEKMEALQPNTVDAATEKHLPFMLTATFTDFGKLNFNIH